jgi:ABC-type arginine transport system ATPase subunit
LNAILIRSLLVVVPVVSVPVVRVTILFLLTVALLNTLLKPIKPDAFLTANYLKNDWEIINEKISKSKITIIASHNLERLKKICTKIFYLENGSIKDS